jgi:hypothetical protein
MVLRNDYLNNRLARAKANLKFWKSLPKNQECEESIMRFSNEKREIENYLKLVKNESQETNLSKRTH